MLPVTTLEGLTMGLDNRSTDGTRIGRDGSAVASHHRGGSVATLDLRRRAPGRRASSAAVTDPQVVAALEEY